MRHALRSTVSRVCRSTAKLVYKLWLAHLLVKLWLLHHRRAVSVHLLLRLHSLHLDWLHWLTWISIGSHAGHASARWSTCSWLRLHRHAPSADQLILLNVAAELVVIDTLLELGKDIVKLHVEIGALLKEHRKLFLHNDSLVDLLEVLSLCRILANCLYDLL